MKNLIIVFLFFCNLKSFAQKESKIDSVFYLIGTFQVPVISHLWEVDEDYPYKYFIFQSRCLPANGKPAYSYNMKVEGEVISEKKLSKLNLVDIQTLIIDTKKILSNSFNGTLTVFFIEPIGKRYVRHQVKLEIADKSPGLTDYENIAPDTTRKKQR